MSDAATLFAVVPIESVDRLKNRGWRLGRCNGLTGTVFRGFETEAEAHSAGGRLPKSYVWSVEPS